jgi:hypothetical protein
MSRDTSWDDPILSDGDFPQPKKAKKQKTSRYKRIYKEYKNASKQEIWEGVRDNFIWGFLGSTLIVFATTKIDIAVLLAYLAYYFYVGRIVNRPKYVTDLGKLIVFPLPTALGAFVGYKVSYLFSSFIVKYLAG